jgi:hypothetical protein
MADVQAVFLETLRHVLFETPLGWLIQCGAVFVIFGLAMQAIRFSEIAYNRLHDMIANARPARYPYTGDTQKLYSLPPEKDY